MEALMDRIRELRNLKGFSQAKLAVKAGMDPATLNRIEQGKGNPNLKTLEKLAETLGVSVVDLLEEPVPLGEAPPPGPSPEAALEEGAKKYRTPAGVEEAQEAIGDLLSQYGVQVRYLTLPQQALEALYDAASSLEEAQEITDRIGLERGELAKYPDARFPGTPTIAIMQSLLTALAGMHRVAEREEVVAGGDIERIEHIRATREQLAQNLELAAAS
jgi:transcriptional regulator with XRE-family HTH domain